MKSHTFLVGGATFFKMSGYRDDVLNKIIELNKIHQKRKSINRLMLWHWRLADKKAAKILSLRAKYDG